jgi:CRISPR/Cas system-associated exonuclease Cas4 (RecB family)
MQEAPTPRSASSFPPEEMVNASELREFIFCERAWFLNRQGFRVSPDALAQRAAGMVFHETRARAATKGRSEQALWWALVRTPSGELIPVERKKKRAPSKGPYDGDLIQATAYCILVEEHYGHTPPFMRIQYADRWFDEPYTLQRKQWVLPICERVRAARRLSDCNRSHRKAAKCRKCGQRDNCGQEL